VPSKLKISSPVVISIPKVEDKQVNMDLKEVQSTIESAQVNKTQSVTSTEKKSVIKTTPATKIEESVTIQTPSEKITMEKYDNIPTETSDKCLPVEDNSSTQVEPSDEKGLNVVDESPIPEVVEERAESSSVSIEEVSVEPEVSDLDTKGPSANAKVATETSESIKRIDDVENASLENSLNELSKNMSKLVSTAVSGYEISTEAEIYHLNLMQKVLTSNVSAKNDAAWNEMFLAAQDKSEKSKMADDKEKEAINAINNVMESIAEGRKNVGTSTNPMLLVAEEAANQAIWLLDQAKGKRLEAQSESSVVEQYKELVEEGKNQFHREMASIMPDVQLGEKNGKLTEDELNMFITHAYKKVLFLQQELAKQQTLEQERFRQALDKQRVEIETLASQQVEGELSKQSRDMRAEHERKMVTLREDAEAELRAQLKRQAAAHTDHLDDVMAVQKAELTRQHQHQLDEDVSNLSAKHLSVLSDLSGQVLGLNKAVSDRAAADAGAVAAQALWLAVNTLQSVVVNGKQGASSWEDKLNPLISSVDVVKKAAGDDSFVETVLGSVSPVALERGVYTEDSLKERFCGVEKVAKKVAGIGEQGGSLFEYGLSYLQSILLVDLSSRQPSESNALLDISSISPVELVTMAKHSLDRGNLGRAVQLIGQLKGEAGRVAADWLDEARLTLETRQAVDALIIHSLANSCTHLPGH